MDNSLYVYIPKHLVEGKTPSSAVPLYQSIGKSAQSSNKEASSQKKVFSVKQRSFLKDPKSPPLKMSDKFITMKNIENKTLNFLRKKNLLPISRASVDLASYLTEKEASAFCSLLDGTQHVIYQLGKEAAASLLSRHPPGSFVLLKGKQPGSLVLAYVDEKKKLAYKTIELGFHSKKKSYGSLEELLRSQGASGVEASLESSGRGGLIVGKGEGRETLTISYELEGRSFNHLKELIDKQPYLKKELVPAALAARLGKQLALAERLTDLLVPLYCKDADEAALAATQIVNYLEREYEKLKDEVEEEKNYKEKFLYEGYLEKKARGISLEMNRFLDMPSLYKKKESSSLPLTIEIFYNPETKKEEIAIHLKSKANWSNRGNFKTTTPSIHYGPGMEKLAVQQIRKPGGLSKQQLEDVECEVKTALNFSKLPSCAKCYGYTTHKKGGSLQVHIFNRFYSGGDLSSFLEERSILTGEEKFKVAHGLLKAASAIHRQNWIHADIHSKNLLIDMDEKTGNLKEAVLADFGLSQGADEELTSGKKLNYQILPPELLIYLFGGAQGQNLFPSLPGNSLKKEFPKEFDVWACGLLLHELFTGAAFSWQDLLPGRSEKEVRQLVDSMESYHSHEPPDRNSTEHLVWEMLRINPAERITLEKALEKLEAIGKKKQIHF